MNETRDVLDCGHEPTTTAGGGTGKAHCDGRTYCYACADSLARQTVRESQPGQRFTAYVDGDGRTVTTWSGGRLGRVIGWGNVHPRTRWSWGGERRYCRVTMDDGSRWHGTAAAGMYAALRRTV